MKHALQLLFVFFVTSFTLSAQTDFELVESVPVGTILDSPDIRNTHEVWLEMINGAKKSLDIEQFYVSNKKGELLDDIIAAIGRAADRGVHVRLIADARMYKTYPETIDSLAKRKNIVSHIIDFGKLAGGVQHSKYFIVDGEQIFLGSQNFDWRSLVHISELGLRIKQKDALRFYQDIFNLDWNLSASNDTTALARFLTPKTYQAPYTIIESGDTLRFTPTASPTGFLPDPASWDEPNIVRLIDGATTDVNLQFLGYDTRKDYTVLDGALRRAAARGVKVRLIVSDWSKGMGSERALKALSLVPNIAVRFSVIPEWSGGYISFARVEHSKFIVVDETSFWLGTSNAERGYFYNTRNLGIIISNRKIARVLRQVFMKSWDGPYTELVEDGTEYQKRNHGEE